jgi:hypothetical protein
VASDKKNLGSVTVILKKKNKMVEIDDVFVQQTTPDLKQLQPELMPFHVWGFQC